MAISGIDVSYHNGNINWKTVSKFIDFAIIRAGFGKNNIDETDCSNVMYVGDGLTDMYAFEYVKEHGGEAVLVYNDNTEDIASEIKMKDIIF